MKNYTLVSILLVFSLVSISVYDMFIKRKIVIHAEKPVYILGYGSLISKNVRDNDLTLIGRPYFNVLIKNYGRKWNYKCDHSVNFPYYTALGVVPEEGGYFNAVMFMVADKGEPIDIAKIDQRETHYRRDEVQSINISCENYEEEFTFKANKRKCSEELKNSEFYIYVVKKEMRNHHPSAEFPLLQTYIDLSINGFVNNKKQAIDFIRTTKGWNNFYFNDREGNTVESLKSVVPLYTKIDNIMNEAFENSNNDKNVNFNWSIIKNNKRSFWRTVKKPKSPW